MRSRSGPVELAGRVRERPSTDQRSEERAVIYRRLVSQLARASLDEPAHVTAELIRALFDTYRLW